MPKDRSDEVADLVRASLINHFRDELGTSKIVSNFEVRRVTGFSNTESITQELMLHTYEYSEIFNLLANKHELGLQSRSSYLNATRMQMMISAGFPLMNVHPVAAQTTPDDRIRMTLNDISTSEYLFKMIPCLEEFYTNNLLDFEL